MKITNFVPVVFAVLFAACANDQDESGKVADADTMSNEKPATEPMGILPNLPSYVVYRNWETGKPENTQLILDVYKTWDSDSPAGLAKYFADSTAYDLPDGTRATTTNATIESKLRKWRKAYKETANVPFSLISLYNKDRDQEWVIAWTWNKWTYTDGTKDSMLYCDNWRIKDAKIVYLNSLQNRPSKPLAKRLDEDVPH